MRTCPIILLILLHIGVYSVAQQLEDRKIEIQGLNRQIILKKDTLYRFHAIIPEYPVKTRAERTYYWYRSDTILATAGGYDGRLLDGSYAVFYPDKNLKEEGAFKEGLRAGEWKDWYPGGKLKSVVHWVDGRKSGPFTEFDINGNMIRKGRYKDDYLSGTVLEHMPDGKLRNVEYKEGMPVVPKKKTTDKHGR